MGYDAECWGDVMRTAAAVAVAMWMLAAPAGNAEACGSSCDCPQGKQCDAAGACKPAGTVSGPGTHPVCCTGGTCAPVGAPCEHPDGSIGECPEEGCAPASCGGLSLGCGNAEDGCGGTVYCGACPELHACIDGICVKACVPDCTDKECGDDGCGGSCGGCPPSWSCKEDFKCGFCKGDCTGKECGSDGCSGSCGECPVGETCTNLQFCVPCRGDCSGRECGDDGCGGSCGTCGFGRACSESGVCECVADCINKECGDNGCGGSCGTCPLGWHCSAQGYCATLGDPEPQFEDVQPVDIVAETPGVGLDASPLDLSRALEALESSGPGADIGRPVECPQGQHAVYGVCARDTPTEKPTESGTGCAVGRSSEGYPMALVTLLLLCATILAARLGRPRLRRAGVLSLILLVLGVACSETRVVGAIDVPGDLAGELPDAPSSDNLSGGVDLDSTPGGGKDSGAPREELQSCTHQCGPKGKTQCSGEQYVLCRDLDSDGCLEWSEPMLCPGLGSCLAGGCQCTPDCTEKECGFDGCYGSCGTCGAGTVCSSYVCVPEGSLDCKPGEVQEEPCWTCGKRTRTCGPEGVWMAWGDCTAGGECSPGTVDKKPCGVCGSQERSCDTECHWGEFSQCVEVGECMPGDADGQPCGKCGIQTRTCKDDCTWGQFEACQGEGVCLPDQVEQQPCELCGTRSRKCGESCTWPAWGPCENQGVCLAGQMQTEACGNCGTHSRSCTPDCQWAEWGQCLNSGPCKPGQTQGCGACGTQQCSSFCQWGACLNEGECIPGTTSTAGCPACRARTCTNQCTWGDQCFGCGGCNAMTQCGMGCPAGYHSTGYSCNLGCGGSCWSDNQTSCAPDCGNSFSACGMGCPSGYHPTGYSCSLSCGDSCFSDNQTTCAANQGASFQTCGMGCPAGYHATGYSCSLSCGDSCWSDNQTTCVQN